jgi:Fur family transcriptional regulator, ferric uptake regulator
MSEPGLKMTKQRRVILEEIGGARNHPSAYEVYEKVRRRLPRVSLGTIYRNLEVLSENKLIRKLEFSGSQRRYDGFTELHSHIRCVRCGRVDDLETEPRVDLTGTGNHAGYKILGHKVELMGICPDCAAQKETNAGKPGEY